MNNGIIGSFTLGGSPWEIVVNPDWLEDQEYTWSKDPTLQTIYVRDTISGMELSYQTLEKEIWEAILYVIMTDIMYYKKEYDNNKTLTPYSSLFYQGISTFSHTDWEGSFSLGAIEYTVTVNNDKAHEEQFFGRCHPGIKRVELCDRKSNGTLYKEDFIWTTFYHELFHAIAAELGKGDSKLNSEKFVNTLAHFVNEIRKTLVINFPEE